MIPPTITTQAVRDAKLIPEDALADAITIAEREHQSLPQYLVERKLVTENALYVAIAKILDVPFVDLRKETIDTETLSLIPATLAVSRRAIAYAATPAALRVAMEDPANIETIELLRRATDRDVAVALATPHAIDEAIRLYHSNAASTVEAITALTMQPERGPEQRNDQELVKLAEELPIVRIIDMLLDHAIGIRASDIHIEPAEDGVHVRERVDGILRPTMILPRNVAPGLIARIKILANLKIDEHRLPQDGRFKVSTPTERLAIRVAIMPIYDGEKAVLRLLRETGKTVSLTELGLRAVALGDAAPLAIVEQNTRKPHGIIFVTGPTGCGKTTTLYAIINRLNEPGVNIATIEDPIEYRIPGINQSQVQPRIGFTFATGLRSLLRQDPNIIMVGEIRDAETADIAVNAALTGHLVLATLHTNDAATSLTRLQEMGVPTFLVASTINCIIAQRLVRKLCPSCRKQTKIPAGIIADLEAYGEDTGRALARIGHMAKSGRAPTLRTLEVWRAAGCAECSEEGYHGRVGIFEVLGVTPTVSACIQERSNRDNIHAQALAEGMATMFVDGLIKAVEGVTSVEEVLRVTRE
ncbi:MAG: GspE/PulE family protein [Candidatus Uhrbacteria bacterium]